MEYRDFVIRIVGGSGGQYGVQVDSPAGQTSGCFQLPWQWDQAVSHLTDSSRATTRDLEPPAALSAKRLSDLREVGETLFRALFPEAVRSLFDQSLGSTNSWSDLGLRIKLRSASRGRAPHPGIARSRSLST